MEAPVHDETVIDLRDYLRIINKWKWIIALITLAAAVTSAIYSSYILQPIFETKAVLLVSQGDEKQSTQTNNNDSLVGVVNTVSRLPQMTINTYVNQVKNQIVFQRVIQSLNLNPNQYSPASIAGMVSASSIKDTNLIEIYVQNADPVLAANVANSTSDEFLKFTNENNQEQLGKSVEFLRQQVGSTDKDLQSAVDKLENFDVQPRSVDYLVKIMEARLNDFNYYRTQENQAKVELSQVLAGKGLVEGQLKKTPATVKLTTKVPSLSTSSQLIEEEQPNPAYSNLEQQLHQKEIDVFEKQARLAAIQSTINSLEREIQSLQNELTTKRTERERLQRDVDRLKSAYNVLAQKITETQIARSINIGATSLLIAARAVPPASPVKPNKQMNVATATVLGLIVSIALSFLMEFLDNTIKNGEDVQRYLGLPVLGYIPLVDKPPLTTTFSQGGSSGLPELPSVASSVLHKGGRPHVAPDTAGSGTSALGD